MPIEYIGNELHNALVTHGVNCTCCDPEESTLHPNREMDARPAFMHVVGGHWRSLVGLFHIRTWTTPEQYLAVVQHDHPRWSHEVSMAGCGSD